MRELTIIYVRYVFFWFGIQHKNIFFPFYTFPKLNNLYRCHETLTETVNEKHVPLPLDDIARHKKCRLISDYRTVGLLKLLGELENYHRTMQDYIS